jgi:hypothetical protein
MLQVLIAYRVHTTGHFHGMPFQVGRTMYGAAGCLAAALVFLWAGVQLMRRSTSN